MSALFWTFPRIDMPILKHGWQVLRVPWGRKVFIGTDPHSAAFWNCHFRKANSRRKLDQIVSEFWGFAPGSNGIFTSVSIFVGNFSGLGSGDGGTPPSAIPFFRNLSRNNLWIDKGAFKYYVIKEVERGDSRKDTTVYRGGGVKALIT